MTEQLSRGFERHTPSLPIVMERSESGFLSITTTTGTSAGPFTLPQPPFPSVFAFIQSEWTSFVSSGTDAHAHECQISLDGGSTWGAPANPGIQAVSSEAGEQYGLYVIQHSAIGAPTGSIQYRCRGTAFGVTADDVRWPKHIFGYMPYVQP